MVGKCYPSGYNITGDLPPGGTKFSGVSIHHYTGFKLKGETPVLEREPHVCMRTYVYARCTLPHANVRYIRAFRCQAYGVVKYAEIRVVHVDT